MYQQLANLACVLAFAIVRARAVLADAWWTAMGDQDRYRPEVHYMRGPGPKWREKHAHVPPGAKDIADLRSGATWPRGIATVDEAFIPAFMRASTRTSYK